jgi:predicted Zn-dependent protease
MATNRAGRPTRGPGRGRGRLVAQAIGLALLLAVAGCSGLGSKFSPASAVLAETGRRTATTDSEENARIVAAYGGVYHDDRVEQTIAAIVSRIVAASDNPDLSYRVTLLNAAAINAFALPDGHLYVTRGLLALATDASEVAAVLAHEMGHVTANHAAQREQRAKNALIAQQAVSDVISDEQSRQLALAASERTLAAFSRQQELEADGIGIRTVARAGYDPYAAARFLGSMAKYSDYRNSLAAKDQRPDFLLTHPSTPERVQFAQESAKAYGAPGAVDPGRDRYLGGIDGMIFGDDPSQGFVRDRSFMHPGLGVGFTVPAGFVLDSAAEAVLATGADGTALRFDAVALSGASDVSTYLKSGWVNGLDANTIQTFSVGSFAGASAKAKAKGWFFQIVVLQSSNGSVYRFIFANEADTAGFRKAASDTVATFRALTATEMASLKPLRVRLVTVAKGDTEAALARRMKGVDRGRDLFDVMNGVAPGAALAVGSRVKIVTDG